MPHPTALPVRRERRTVTVQLYPARMHLLRRAVRPSCLEIFGQMWRQIFGRDERNTTKDRKLTSDYVSSSPVSLYHSVSRCVSVSCLVLQASFSSEVRRSENAFRQPLLSREIVSFRSCLLVVRWECTSSIMFSFLFV